MLCACVSSISPNKEDWWCKAARKAAPRARKQTIIDTYLPFWLSVINISFNISLFLKKRKHQLCLVVCLFCLVCCREKTGGGERSPFWRERKRSPFPSSLLWEIVIYIQHNRSNIMVVRIIRVNFLSEQILVYLSHARTRSSRSFYLRDGARVFGGNATTRRKSRFYEEKMRRTKSFWTREKCFGEDGWKDKRGYIRIHFMCQCVWNVFMLFLAFLWHRGVLSCATFAFRWWAGGWPYMNENSKREAKISFLLSLFVLREDNWFIIPAYWPILSLYSQYSSHKISICSIHRRLSKLPSTNSNA